MRGVRTSLAVMALAAALTGCGSGDGGEAASAPPVPEPVASSGSAPAAPGATTTPDVPASTPTPPSSSATKAMTELAACMKKLGIEIPSDPSATWSPPPGYDPVKAQKAFQKCLPTQVPTP